MYLVVLYYVLHCVSYLCVCRLVLTSLLAFLQEMSCLLYDIRFRAEF